MLSVRLARTDTSSSSLSPSGVAEAAPAAAAAAEDWSPSVPGAGGPLFRSGPPSAVPCVAALNSPAEKRQDGGAEAFEKKATEEGGEEGLRSQASSAPVQLREPGERWKSRAMDLDEFWGTGEGGDAPDERRPKKRQQQQMQPAGAMPGGGKKQRWRVECGKQHEGAQRTRTWTRTRTRLPEVSAGTRLPCQRIPSRSLPSMTALSMSTDPDC
jgi:hypothetical protein